MLQQKQSTRLLYSTSFFFILNLNGPCLVWMADVSEEPAARRRAWVTLLTNESYAKGVMVLHRALVAVGSQFPLLVMVTDGVPQAVKASLESEGCELVRVKPLQLPRGRGGPPQYECAHFAECWLKLRMWEWELEFEQLVYLDADMLPLQNMDELLKELLCQQPALAAVPECSCVIPRCGMCPYRLPPPAVEPDAAVEYVRGGADTEAAASGRASYFNAGLLVLVPSLALVRLMHAELARCDLSTFRFAEQDFLNHFFCGGWRALPWVYNATKALYACHRETIWDYSQVKNVHYTMAKPWELGHQCNRGYEKLNSLWLTAFSTPDGLCRQLFKLHLEDKRRRRTLQTAPQDSR